MSCKLILEHCSLAHSGTDPNNTFDFVSFSHLHSYNIENIIVFPPEDRILAYADELEKTKNFNRDSAQDTRSINQIMSPYLNNDKINEMHDQERNAIWSKR